jgi:uncharacterized protein YcnI
VSRLLARLAVVALAGSALSLGFVSAASAHVTVHSVDAVQGGHAELSFQVPTESDTASTVKLAVAFPTDTPIASVSVLPHPGWAYKVTKTTLPQPVPDGEGGQLSQVVGQIEWTATGKDSAVKPGEYEVFRVAAGPLPKTAQLVFKVVQSYDDNTVVRWIDVPAAGSPAPEHPAPVLTLPASSGAAGTSHVMPAAAAPASGAPSMAWWAMAVTGIAVLAALGAIVIASRAVRRRGGEHVPA